MRAAHQRLIRCDEDVLAECRVENPTVTSEIQIRDLVTFKASRLMQEIKLKEVNLNEAIYNVNSTDRPLELPFYAPSFNSPRHLDIQVFLSKKSQRRS